MFHIHDIWYREIKTQGYVYSVDMMDDSSWKFIERWYNIISISRLCDITGKNIDMNIEYVLNDVHMDFNIYRQLSN